MFNRWELVVYLPILAQFRYLQIVDTGVVDGGNIFVVATKFTAIYQIRFLKETWKVTVSEKTRIYRMVILPPLG